MELLFLIFMLQYTVGVISFYYKEIPAFIYLGIGQ